MNADDIEGELVLAYPGMADYVYQSLAAQSQGNLEKGLKLAQATHAELVKAPKARKSRQEDAEMAVWLS